MNPKLGEQAGALGLQASAQCLLSLHRIVLPYLSYVHVVTQTVEHHVSTQTLHDSTAAKSDMTKQGRRA